MAAVDDDDQSDSLASLMLGSVKSKSRIQQQTEKAATYHAVARF